MLHPDYLDGVQEARRAVDKKPLPSPRVVSNFLVKNNLEVYSTVTLALAVWGNFIEHDLSHTATNKMSNIKKK